MITHVTTSCDPEQTWQQQALTALESALGQPLDLWSSRPATGWTLQQSSSRQYEIEPFGEVAHENEPQLLELIQKATSQDKPLSKQRSPGEYLLAIPLSDNAAATTSVSTDRPELLVGLADVGKRFLDQQEDLIRLREENDFFLKQVSDDFEELTFLRSIAERLGLGDSTHTIEQLTAASLPELGKSTHSEELFFVANSDDAAPEIVAQWQMDELDESANEEATILHLVQEYQTAAAVQPLIKNSFDSTEAGRLFPSVRDFILVSVGATSTPVGWFLAINRRVEHEQGPRNYPEWRLNQHEFGTSEASLLSTASAMAASHANNLALFQEREMLLVNVVRTLVSAVEAKDNYTCGHSERVALYGKRLAQQVGYSEEACQLLYLTGLLHDVGKIAINDAILNKPDGLTDEEFAEIQRHPEEGWKILQELQQLSYVLPGVLHHHERIDGKGYPDGLQGLDIPLDGRVLAVADAYDAMTSDRAYRTGMPHDKAISILRDGAGTQWDTEAIAAFLEIESEITTIRKSYRRIEKPNRRPTPVGPATTTP